MARISATGSEGSSDFLYPDGSYNVRCVSCTPGKSAAAQNPQLEVRMKVLDGEFEGKTVMDWIPLSGNCGWKLHPFLDAVFGDNYDKVETSGTDKDGKALYDFDFDTDDAIDVEFSIVNKVKESIGYGKQNRWKYQPAAAQSARTGVSNGRSAEVLPEAPAPVEDAPRRERRRA